jgi:phosphoribosyl-dephospho-CoA transferase
MKHETADGFECNLAEQQFVERLRQHPELLARFQSILELTRNADGPVKTADEVEEQLIAELRQLGHLTMNQWATQAEQRVSAELQAADATVRSRKKKR